jgi:hypothetical protein
MRCHPSQPQKEELTMPTADVDVTTSSFPVLADEVTAGMLPIPADPSSLALWHLYEWLVKSMRETLTARWAPTSTNAYADPVFTHGHTHRPDAYFLTADVDEQNSWGSALAAIQHIRPVGLQCKTFPVVITNAFADHNASLQELASTFRLSTHLAQSAAGRVHAWTVSGPSGYWSVGGDEGPDRPTSYPEPLQRVEWLRDFLSVSREQALLIAGIPTATYYSWRKNPEVAIRPNTVERLGRVVATIRLLEAAVGGERTRDLLNSGHPTLIAQLAGEPETFEKALGIIAEMGRPVIERPVRRAKDRAQILERLSMLDDAADAAWRDGPPGPSTSPGGLG